MPKVSIVIPVHNRERLVKRAIRSCLAQTEADFEVNVVDDGSTDKTQEAVRCFNDPRIRLFTQSRNMGVGPARNRGVDEARGEWIAVLDSDDELVPEAVATIVRNAEEYPDTDGFWFRCRLDDGSISPWRFGVVAGSKASRTNSNFLRPVPVIRMRRYRCKAEHLLACEIPGQPGP